MLIFFKVYMKGKMVNLNLKPPFFNRSQKIGYVNYITLNILPFVLTELYLCEKCKLCFCKHVHGNAFDEVRLFILHCPSL